MSALPAAAIRRDCARPGIVDAPRLMLRARDVGVRGVVLDETVSVEAELDLEDFCQRVFPRLVGALSLSYGDADLAEELAQEALSRVVERWERVRSLDDPEAYTFRTAFNLGRSWWRQRMAERRALTRSEAAPTETSHDSADALAIRQALGALSPRQREVLVYRYFLERTVRETALAMACAEGTVKALTSQAIDALRATGMTEHRDG